MMRLEVRSIINYNQTITAMQLNPKKKNRSSQESPRNPARHWKPRASLTKSFWKYLQGNATYRTSQCDVCLIIFLNAIENNTSNIWKLLQFGLIAW